MLSSSRGISRKFARKFRQLSFRYIYPWAPAFHGFLFFELRRRAIGLSVHLAGKKLPLSSVPGYLFKCTLRGAAQEYRPKVSIIVPCYNHALYLEKRLDSISSQTYANTEVILLDDASSDNSASLLREYAARYPGHCRVVVNECNSRSPFRQWKKGIRMASGDLIWIAESDDYCDSLFLERMVSQFANQGVMLAFCRTKFVADDGLSEVWSMQNYLPELGAGVWEREFIASSFQLTQQIWNRKNIIPNVSSAVFRNTSFDQLLDDSCWLNMRICGDWLFYLQISSGGYVAYVPTASCFYRQHASNTSVSLHKDEIYLIEHLAVAEYVISHGGISSMGQKLLKSELMDRWYQHHTESIPTHLFNRIEALTPSSDSSLSKDIDGPLRILMVAYSLIPGGGEILPLRLANLLKQRGHVVTVLDCNQHASEEGVRKILRSDIPLVQLSSLEAFTQIIESLGVMIVHTHNAWVDTTVAELTQGINQACHVITSHGMYDEIDPTDYPRIGRLLCPTVGGVAYVADKNVKPLLKLGFERSKLTKISNAVDAHNIQPIDRKMLGIRPDDFVLCIVSRAIREKGWQEAIEAMILAQARTSRRLHLLIGGEGPEQLRLSKIYGDRREIHFLGFQASPCDVYAACDLGILPTFYPGESQPLTLLECLVAGKPFLTTCVGETSAMLTTPQGMAGETIPLVNGTIDVAKFADVIYAYCSDPVRHERDCKLAKIASKAFSGHQMAIAYEHMYKRVLKSKIDPTCGNTAKHYGD